MTLSPRERTRVVETLAEVHREVQALRGLFRLAVNGETYSLPVTSYDWQQIKGVPGVEMAAMPVAEWPPHPPSHTDYFWVRGQQGAQQKHIIAEQAIVVEVLQGSLLYWKKSAPSYVPYQAGDVFRLAPGELHAFVATTDFLNRVAFTPRLTEPI